ncbi:MAG: hypothetical protein ACREF8_06785, partial [Chthoniobacterales bacterium]
LMAELEDFTSSIAILVSSCDAFFDAWKPFVAFFEKFWSDCPLDAFLLTNQLTVRSDRFQPLATGEDRAWSSNLLAALARLPHPYVLYLQEDYFLTAPVARAQLAQDFAEAVAVEADSLCFHARVEPDPGFRWLNDRYGAMAIDSDFRTRCQVTLWKRSALQSILREGETAWNFEARGSARTQAMEILSYKRLDDPPIPYLMSAISRGLWTPEAVTMCREHGVAIEPFFRPLSAPQPWQQRLRRALGRVRLKRALRRQADRVIQL